MSPVWKVAAFFAQSVAVGLALAFVAVLVKPELIGRSPSARAPGPTSYSTRSDGHLVPATTSSPDVSWKDVYGGYQEIPKTQSDLATLFSM